MNRRQRRQRRQFQVAKQHQSHAINSIVTAIGIARPTGHRPTRIPLSTATKIAFYRLPATPIANWPPPNTLNRVAVGIFFLPDPFPIIITIIPPSFRAAPKNALSTTEFISCINRAAAAFHLISFYAHGRR